MNRALFLAIAVLLVVPAGFTSAEAQTVQARAGATDFLFPDEELVHRHIERRLAEDYRALEAFRPGYHFWQNIFMIPDGSVAFGSATDGRLLAVFPVGGDWTSQGRWEDPTLASVVRGRSLPRGLGPRRERVSELLEAEVGPVVHNRTRGRFLLPNARRYGSFVEEWGRIFERFGVPAEVGLAQAIVESGLNGRIRSEAGALGLCQWLPRNWNRLKRLSPHEIEGYNQTTQVPYCAAYLTILATKYGSFIPALSEHHAGGANVGRTVINGHRLGAGDVRAQYLLGSEFARNLRTISTVSFREVVRSYGPRSYLYAEMVFGNAYTVRRIREETPQERIYAMRARRAIPLEEITRRTGLSADEVRRFNPALVRQVPRTASLYLPMRVEDFGPDVSFWHGPPSPEFASTLSDFVRLGASPEEWDDPSFAPVLRQFRERFAATRTEEGIVMATVLAYVIEDAASSGRHEILVEFRNSQRVLSLFEAGLRETEALRGSPVSAR